MLRFPPRRILVAVDLSNASRLAWRAASEIALRFNAKPEAVWCMEPVITEFTGIKNLSRRPEYRRDMVERLRERFGKETRLHVVAGAPVPSLRRLARDRSIDLLVVGTHRRKGFERLVLGSVSEALVHDAPCPVLVVPKPWRTPLSILAPIHGAAYARRGLAAGGVLARAFHSKLKVLHVVANPAACPDPEALLRGCIAQLPAGLALAVKPETEVRRGDPIREILIAERGHDLVILVAHRKSLLGDLVLGTTVERVLRHSRVPVLAIPSR